MKSSVTARAVLALLLLAGGVGGCASPSPPIAESASAAPQLKPGEVRVRMNGQLGWYGGVSSNGR